jgi:hypothetical protein
MIEVIAEHSVDTDLLPTKAVILDLGCRGFAFTDELRRRGHKVFPVDIDRFENEEYYQFAISNKSGRVGVKRTDDPQATTITEGNEVLCMTLPEFMDVLGTAFVDLIKIDIEGSEYEVIISLTSAPATQLSIEFHLHTGVYKINELTQMVKHLEALGYTAVQHEKTAQHGCGFNYWDSLFVLL